MEVDRLANLHPAILSTYSLYVFILLHNLSFDPSINKPPCRLSNISYFVVGAIILAFPSIYLNRLPLYLP